MLDEILLRMKSQFVLGERNLYSYWANLCYYVKEFIPGMCILNPKDNSFAYLCILL